MKRRAAGGERAPSSSRGKTSVRPSTGSGRTAGKKRAASPAASGTRAAKPAPPASRLIDQRIAELAGWRGETLARLRALIHEADPEIVEEWKWDVPVWSHGGIVCTGEAYAKAVKLTFARGASIPDPERLFNSSLEGNTRRAIDVHEGETLDAAAFKALVEAAVERNGAPASAAKATRARRRA